MKTNLINSILVIALFSVCVNADCSWHYANWYHNLRPYHSCNTNEWLAKTEVREGSLWYYCCNGSKFEFILNYSFKNKIIS